MAASNFQQKRMAGVCYQRYSEKPEKGPVVKSSHNDLESEVTLTDHPIRDFQRKYVRAELSVASDDLNDAEKEELGQINQLCIEPTNSANHKEKFWQFLRLEEIAFEDSLDKTNPTEPVRLERMGPVEVVEKGKTIRYVKFSLKLPANFPVPDEWRQGGSIWLRKYLSQDRYEYQSRLMTERDGSFSACFSQRFSTIFDVTRTNFQAVFQHSRYQFQSRYEAVKFANEFRQSTLFPKSIRLDHAWIMHEINFFFNELIKEEDEAQREAVRAIVNAKQVGIPYLLLGQPGTGKTTVLVEAILQILTWYQRANILVCTGSNSAADYITERICEQLGDFGYGYDEEVLLRFNCTSRSVEETSETVQKFSDIRTVDGRPSFHIPGKDVINSKRVVITTCSNAIRLVNADRGKSSFRFAYLLIDEAARMTEPESLIPLGLFAPEQAGSLVLAGDVKSLGPVILSRHARGFNYDVSWMERLSNERIYYESQNAKKPDKLNPLLATRLN